MSLCTIFYDFFASHEDSLHVFGNIIWILNILSLAYFIIELLMRNVKWKQLSHVYLMVILSMISSIISSACFTTSHHSKIMCFFGPTIAISMRTMSKTFTWGLYIIRAQLVMESFDNIYLSQFAQKVPYVLLFQCISMISLITIFTQTTFIDSTATCSVTYPFSLLICSAVIGEIFYGLGFMYIFYKAMSISMKHVYDSLRPTDANETKKQIRHHIIVYSIQLISSILFLFFVSLCICFETLNFFEVELFVSNICLLMLFRGKIRIFKQWLTKCNCGLQNEINLATLHNQNRSSTKKHPHYSQRQISFRNLSSKFRSHKFIAQYSANSNYFLSNKWRSNQEVANIKHAINITKNTSNMPPKAVELFGVNTNTNSNKLTPTDNTIEIITHIDGKHHQFDTINISEHKCNDNNSETIMTDISHHKSHSATDINIIHKNDKMQPIKTRLIKNGSHMKAQSALLLTKDVIKFVDFANNNNNNNNKHMEHKSSFLGIKTLLNKFKANNSIGSVSKNSNNKSKSQLHQIRKTLMEEDFGMVEAFHRNSHSNSKDMTDFFDVPRTDNDTKNTGLHIHSESDPFPIHSTCLCMEIESSNIHRETLPADSNEPQVKLRKCLEK